LHKKPAREFTQSLSHMRQTFVLRSRGGELQQGLPAASGAEEITVHEEKS
jgi:hypothetical protein